MKLPLSLFHTRHNTWIKAEAYISEHSLFSLLVASLDNNREVELMITNYQLLLILMFNVICYCDLYIYLWTIGRIISY